MTKRQLKITHFYESTNNKYKQQKITTYFKKKKVYGYNELTEKWHCLECGICIGSDPRQLCRKSYCDGYISE